VTRVRVTKLMMETSPREEGDDGHNNQLGTKTAAMARTVVATTARAIMTAARVMATGAKRVMARMATTATTATTAMMATTAMTVAMAKMATMTPNSNDATSGNECNEDTK
jgi:hypothetical protein